MNKLKRLTGLVLAFILIITAMPRLSANSKLEKKVFKNTLFKISCLRTEAKEIKNGNDFKLKFELENVSDFDLNEVDFDLREVGYETDKANRYFNLSDKLEKNTSHRKFSLKKGEKTEFNFELKAKEELITDKYPVTLSFKMGEIEVLDRIYINVVSDKNVIKADSGDQAEGTEDILKKELASLPKEQDPNLPLAPEKPQESPKPEENKPGQGQEAPIPAPELGGGSVNLSSAGPNSSGDSSQMKNKPKLIVDKYSFSPEMPLAGEQFVMKLSFYNTNADKSVRNIKIFLTSQDTAQSATPNTPAPSSSVFTPVDSSNTFYIPYIDPNGKIEKSVTLTTVPTLQAKIYQVTANFEYEDKDGNQFTAQELIGIPIVQKSKLQTSEVTLPETISVGEESNGTIEFYNTGKDTLYNLMVRLEGDFNTKTKQNYVGNFQSGASDSFQIEITPTKTGENSGKVTFTYEDATGKEQKIEKEFKINVQEAMMPEFDPNNPNMGKEGEMMEPEQPAGLLNKYTIGGGLVLIGAVAGFVIYKKRKAKKAKEELTIDED